MLEATFSTTYKDIPMLIGCQLYVCINPRGRYLLIGSIQLHQICSGMEYLHENMIIHGNLKAVIISQPFSTQFIAAHMKACIVQLARWKRSQDSCIGLRPFVADR